VAPMLDNAAPLLLRQHLQYGKSLRKIGYIGYLCADILPARRGCKTLLLPVHVLVQSPREFGATGHKKGAVFGAMGTFAP
jgi:hypothetical protein